LQFAKNWECRSVSEIAGNGQDKAFANSLKQIEVMVQEMGESGSDLLAKYFVD
jgi:hypothetical protein